MIRRCYARSDREDAKFRGDPTRMRARGRRPATGAPQVSFKELLDSWRQSAAAPRTARTYAVRLAVDDAAQLAALAEMFPGRTPEQLISELLSVALKGLAAAMPYVPGTRVISTDEHGDPVYEDAGPTPRFMELARLHRRALQVRPQHAVRAKKRRPRRT